MDLSDNDQEQDDPAFQIGDTNLNEDNQKQKKYLQKNSSQQQQLYNGDEENDEQNEVDYSNEGIQDENENENDFSKQQIKKDKKIQNENNKPKIEQNFEQKDVEADQSSESSEAKDNCEIGLKSENEEEQNQFEDDQHISGQGQVSKEKPSNHQNNKVIAEFISHQAEPNNNNKELDKELDEDDAYQEFNNIDEEQDEQEQDQEEEQQEEQEQDQDQEDQENQENQEDQEQKDNKVHNQEQVGNNKNNINRSALAQSYAQLFDKNGHQNPQLNKIDNYFRLFLFLKINQYQYKKIQIEKIKNDFRLFATQFPELKKYYDFSSQSSLVDFLLSNDKFQSQQIEIQNEKSVAEQIITEQQMKIWQKRNNGFIPDDLNKIIPQVIPKKIVMELIHKFTKIELENSKIEGHIYGYLDYQYEKIGLEDQNRLIGDTLLLYESNQQNAESKTQNLLEQHQRHILVAIIFVNTGKQTLTSLQQHRIYKIGKEQNQDILGINYQRSKSISIYTLKEEGKKDIEKCTKDLMQHDTHQPNNLQALQSDILIEEGIQVSFFDLRPSEQK